MESLRWAPQNVVPQPGGGEPVRFLPMALDLYYLMSAFSAGNYHWEQQAMSVALRIFHASPIIRSPAASPVPWELTLTMEHRSYDEMSRLWQATTSALRLSVIYRAAVVFIDPDTPPPPARESAVANFIVEPLPAGAPAGVELFGTFRRASYRAPSGVVPFTQAPATAAAGQTGLAGGRQPGRRGDLAAVGVRDGDRHLGLGRRGLDRDPDRAAGPERGELTSGRAAGPGPVPGPGGR